LFSTHNTSLSFNGRDPAIQRGYSSDWTPRKAMRCGSPSYEQLRDCLGEINSRQGAAKLGPLATFALVLEFLADWKGRILPFDAKAHAMFTGFDKKLIRDIGALDAMIASITLAHRATLLSANLRDFERVPGLAVEDWLRA
jgi:hypothetical protein